MVTEGYRWTQALLFFRTGLSTEWVKYKVKIIEYLPQRTKRARSNYKRSLLWFSFFTLWECSIYIRSIFLVGPKYIQKHRICNLVLIWLSDWLIGWFGWLIAHGLLDWMLDWLINWRFNWLMDWSIDWLTDWWPVIWLFDWFASWLTYFLIHWFDWLVDWLIDFCYI